MCMFLRKTAEIRFREVLKNLIKGELIVRKTDTKCSKEKGLFWLCLRRFISHSKAIVLLCDKKHNLEALMLLRPLFELIVNLHLCLEDEKELQNFIECSKYELKDGIPVMGKKWTDSDLCARMAKLGFSRDYYDMVIRKLNEELHCNPGVVSRGHHKNLTEMDNKAVFLVATQVTRYLLRTANNLYPEVPFMDYKKLH